MPEHGALGIAHLNRANGYLGHKITFGYNTHTWNQTQGALSSWNISHPSPPISHPSFLQCVCGCIIFMQFSNYYIPNILTQNSSYNVGKYCKMITF